jgi:hypothetical protein
MMTKLEMIPLDSHFRHTYIHQIPLHQEIRNVYTIRAGTAVEAKGGEVSNHIYS